METKLYLHFTEKFKKCRQVLEQMCKEMNRQGNKGQCISKEIISWAIIKITAKSLHGVNKTYAVREKNFTYVWNEHLGHSTFRECETKNDGLDGDFLTFKEL